MLVILFTLVLEAASASPFRVLVFPHHGSYPIPQGREKEVSQVQIVSEHNCNQFQAQLNNKLEWQKVGDLIQSEKNISLSAVELRKKGRAHFFECSSPFKVYRDVGQTAYTYEGHFCCDC
jgi:hypothetical protein